MLTLFPPTECSRARESMSAQLDGELSELGSARLAAHLRECSACTTYALELAAITTRLRTAALEQPTSPMALPRRRRPFQITAAAAAAAVAVAAGASLALGNVLGSGASRSGSGAARAAAMPISIARAVSADAAGLDEAPPVQGRRVGALVVV